MSKRAVTPALLLLASLLACGGSDSPPAAGTPTPPAGKSAAAAPAAKPAAGAKGGAKKVAVDTSLEAQDSTQLQREIFSYRGAGRDPFLSLLKSADSRPLVTDVRVAGISYDAAYPARSVAVLRDTAQHKRYSVRVGDELGRMKVTEIRGDAVVVTLDEFGQERQVVLSVKRSKQEETQ